MKIRDADHGETYPLGWCGPHGQDVHVHLHSGAQVRDSDPLEQRRGQRFEHKYMRHAGPSEDRRDEGAAGEFESGNFEMETQDEEFEVVHKRSGDRMSMRDWRARDARRRDTRRDDRRDDDRRRDEEKEEERKREDARRRSRDSVRDLANSSRASSINLQQKLDDFWAKQKTGT